MKIKHSVELPLMERATVGSLVRLLDTAALPRDAEIVLRKDYTSQNDWNWVWEVKWETTE